MTRIIHPWAGHKVIFTNEQHKAIGSPGGEDYEARSGSPVIAAADGRLEYIGGRYNTVNLYVKVSPKKEIVLEYKENRNVPGLAVGQSRQVKLGDVIAFSGLKREGQNKAPHLDVFDAGKVSPITSYVTPPVQHVAATILASGATLHSGESMVSGDWELVCQPDGNLVLYRAMIGGRKAVWHAKSFIPGTFYTMQQDGNFVGYIVFKGKRKAVWKIAKLTLRHRSGSHLSLQGTDGNIVVYAPDSKVMWSRK